MQLPNPLTRRALLVGVSALAIIIAGLLVIVSILNQKEQASPTSANYTRAQIKSDRESARVYIDKSSPYRDILSPEAQSFIERTLYGYAHLAGGNDLYTGTVRTGSYTVNRLSDGSFNLGIIIDISPDGAAYKVSVEKNKTTNNREIIRIICAQKSEQTNKTIKCIDEQGR